MPSWKKVIVSGSDAFLNALTVTNGITGSLHGTASWAQNAITASYVLNAVSASYALNADLLDGRDSSVFATTGSNIFVGNQTVTGSLFTTGSNTLIGSTSLTGSLNISGSETIRGYIQFEPVTTNINTAISASYIYVSGSTNDLYFSQNGSGYSNVTRLRWLEGNLYTGLLHGGLITTQSSTVYQISSGSGIIVDLNASLSNDPFPTIQFLQWGNLSASIAPFTASYQQAFVGIDSTNNIYAQGTPFSNGQFSDIINVGNVLFQNQSTINGVKTQPSVAYGFEQQQNTFNRAFGPLKLSGYTLAPSGSSTGSLIVASGTAYAPGSNYTIDPNDPSYTIDPGTNVSKIFRYHQSGSTWVYNTNAGAGFATIDPTKYSNNGVLTNVGGGNWTIQRCFYFPNSVTKAIVVYYGNARYGTEAEARGNIDFESFVEAPNTSANAIYLGAIIINGTGVFTSPGDFTIYPGGLFRQVGGSGGGGSIVTQTLAGLSDVLISGPTDGQALVYNHTAAKWENKSSISASITGNAATATSASFATTASYVLNAVSASFATSSSQAQNANTASYVLNAVSASFATSASQAQNATTASYVLNAVSASFASTASYVSSNFQYEIHVSQIDGNDTTGDGSLLKPVASITKALTLTTAQRRVIVLHPGGYTENPTIPSGSITIQTTELTGGNTVLYGTLTIPTSGSGARISGFSMDNLTISGTAQAYVSNCTINSNVVKSSSGYVEITNSEMQCTSGIQISGAGTTIINGNKNVGILVSNASAQVIVKGCNGVETPSASAGNLAIVDCIVTAIGGNAITITGASTTLTLLNSQVLVQAGNNVAPISVEGIYSIINTIYDKPNSTLTGTSTNSIDYFQYINADNITSTNGLTVTGSITVSGSVINTLTSSFAISSSQATSASFATTSSYALNAVTASFVTASNVYGPFGSNSIVSASYALTASYALSTAGAGGETTKLFQTTASTTWSFSHNLGEQYPQIDVYDGTNKIVIPSQIEAVDANNMLIYFASPTSGVAAASIGGVASNQTASYATTFTINGTTLKTDTNTDVDTGTEVISTVSTAFYDGAFFDYRIKSGSNLRVGTVTAVWSGSTAEYSDVSVNDIGNTLLVTMSVDISSSFARLLATTSTNNWDVKTFVRMI